MSSGRKLIDTASPIFVLRECWVSVPLLLQSIGTQKAQLSGDPLMANLRVPMMRIPRASLTGIESSGVNKGECYDRIGSMLLATDKEDVFSVSTHPRGRHSALFVILAGCSVSYRSKSSLDRQWTDMQMKSRHPIPKDCNYWSLSSRKPSYMNMAYINLNSH